MDTNYEDDDDTHYCIKCHLTVSGLDNYVRHRQTGCRPAESKNVVTSEPSSTDVSYPEILNADAFFSSLELQSSSKSKPSATRFLEPEKKSERLGGRRKRTKRYQETDVSSSPKEKLMTLPPVVTDLDDPTDHIGIPSLVGFPDIVPFTEKSSTTSTSKLQSSTNSKPLENEKKRNEDDRVWLDDLEDYDTNKETVSAADSDTEYDYQHDEDSDVESPVDDIGQDDSYSETDDPDDREYPPQAHTGGKWKPGQLLHHMTVPNDDELDQDDYHHEGLVPPHTGGKWKPTEKAEEDEPVEDEKEDEDKESVLTRNSRQPPLGHTRGKWIPGASVGSEVGSGYWCAPCGRKLASKLVYTRHLRSDLHARRSIQEIEGDVKLPRSVGPLLRKKAHSRRQKILAIQAESKKITVDNNRSTKRKRRREKQVLRCEMCHARVRRLQLGKHLLSHYHCRVAGLNPCSPAARRFILENMGNVVRQCPFQCASCRFYCNTEDTFLRHWRSNLHANSCIEDDKNYTCMCCDYWCNGDSMMETHLLSLEHRETVAMINSSVPIVIRRQRFLSCETCNRRFRYNLQLRIHAKETGHPDSWTASDEYQQRIQCTLCPQVLRSLLALQRHQLACHKSSDSKDKISAPYFCSFCSINFETARDAVLHRRTPSHKQIVKERKFESGVPPLNGLCGHCGKKCNNLTEYKQHLLQNHSHFCHRCLNCGQLFALSQDLTKHTKYDECQKNIIKTTEPESMCTSDQRKCPECSFITKSEAEFIFHQILHAGNVELTSEEPSSSKTSMFCCPICKKLFRKTSLRAHIRSHTKEKPYVCLKCLTSFSRKSSLNLHINQCQSGESSEKKTRLRNYICLDCDAAFYTKYNLRQHMLRHTGKHFKCRFSGCPTVLRTEAELKTHQALTHECKDADRKFQCNECSYAAKTITQLRRHQTRHEAVSSDTQQLSCTHKDCRFTTRFRSHLKRHFRLHTGIKPYKCPHCSYASNNIENLRKHVLSTRLHPGKTIYECDQCKKKKKGTEAVYVTNFSKELRAHLIEEHSEEFPTPGHVNSYVAGMFGSDGQSTPHE